MSKDFSANEHDNNDVKDAKRRVKKLQKDEALQEWIERLREVAKKQPVGVWLYVESGSLNVMALDDRGSRYTYPGRDGGSMTEAVVENIDFPNIDGGGW